MSSTPALTATTSRRSSRLAVKPTVSYAEYVEVPDEVLMEKTQAMFETLLEERYATATRDLPGVYWRCHKEFLNLYADLPVDDVERIAAETFESKLPSMANGHPIARKHLDAQDAKRQNALAAEIKAKVSTQKKALDSLIGEYNAVINAKAEYETKLATASKAIATHAATLNATIRGERNAGKRTDMSDLVYRLSSETFAKLRPADSGLNWEYARHLMRILHKGKLPTSYVVPKLL